MYKKHFLQVRLLIKWKFWGHFRWNRPFSNFPELYAVNTEQASINGSSMQNEDSGVNMLSHIVFRVFHSIAL